MPLKNGHATQQERVFTSVMARTGDHVYAGEKAGYAHPAKAASKALARPAVQQEIARQQLQRLFDDALPLAIEQHIALLRSNTTPAGAKVQAIKLAYEHTLALGDALNPKDPSEMTGAELAEALEKLKRIRSERARVIDAEVVEVAPGAGVFD